jgi:N-acyl homoserine lactone hydrolase
VAGERQILPGVHLVPTPGHTPGHQSVAIDKGSGLAVLAGQAIYSAAEYRQMVSTGQLAAGGRGNAERALASARRLVGPDPRHVYFSHDKTRWDRA